VLDIRATHYISPLSEVDFASVELTVHLVNVADETGLITGKFRIYNDTTGLLIHTSDIAPLSLAAGAAADVSALTDFDPPAPADDVYFVLFDGKATNALVPDGITFTLGQFYFDVTPTGMGPAPAAHHATHEDGGSDELEVSDLGTSELDDTLILQPDGAGGVEWAAAVAGVTDHGDLTGLTDNDHPQYLRVLAQTLVDGANIPWDLNLGGHANVTLLGNRTLDNPTNMVAGALYSLRVIQDGAGSRTLSWSSAYLWPRNISPTLSTAAAATDTFIFLCTGTTLIAVAAVFKSE
jgi:hypothetical protein